MAAVSVVPDPTVEVPSSALSPGWLAVAVALASFTIIILAFAGLALDIRDRRRTELEADRMRGLANAAVEGLIVCQDDVIVAVNNSFAIFVGVDVNSFVGTKLEQYFPDEDTRDRLLAQQNQPVETSLIRDKGKATIPVELIQRPIDFSGKPHHAIAVRDLRARKQAERHIHYLAHHDALTGLPNRTTSTEARSGNRNGRAAGQPVAVLCLDLDRFKEVNDLFGHAAGDTLLQTVAKCVTTVLGADQMMARLGGDEFAVILPAISGPSAAGRVAESILEALQDQNAPAPTAALMSTSIGIAICPNDAVDRQALLTMRIPLYIARSWTAVKPIDSSKQPWGPRCEIGGFSNMICVTQFRAAS